MNASKVKVVVNALREELHARRATASHHEAGTADDAAVSPSSAAAGAHLARDDATPNKQRQRLQHQSTASRDGVLVHLSDDALAAAHGSSALLKHQNRGRSALSQRPIPEVVVPFLVPQEPLVSVAPYAVLAMLAATALVALLLIVL